MRAAQASNFLAHRARCSAPVKPKWTNRRAACEYMVLRIPHREWRTGYVIKPDPRLSRHVWLVALRESNFSRARSDARLDRLPVGAMLQRYGGRSPTRCGSPPLDPLRAAQSRPVALRDRGRRKHLSVDVHAAVTGPAVDLADELPR